MHRTKLSDRVRPNSEVAPWVYEEIVAMENAMEQLRVERDAAIESDKESIAMYHRCREARDHFKDCADALSLEVKNLRTTTILNGERINVIR